MTFKLDRVEIGMTERAAMGSPYVRRICNDCGGYTPQQKRWGTCQDRAFEDGNQVVKHNRKACAEFRYYRGGYDG